MTRTKEEAHYEKQDRICFDKKDLKGSRLRCLWLTNMPTEQVANFLTTLIKGIGTVTPTDKWMPRGFLEPGEAKLGETSGFLSESHRTLVTDWWLVNAENSNTPNWDLLSTCSINGEPGLLMIEAKAHHEEFKRNDHCNSGPENLPRIQLAIEESSRDFTNDASSCFSGWGLSTTKCYQLSNRFAWARKVASLGIPVVLVYLGFLNAYDMSDRYNVFNSGDEWRDCVINGSTDIVPREVWNKQLAIGKGSLVTLIRSAEVSINSQVRAID